MRRYNKNTLAACTLTEDTLCSLYIVLQSTRPQAKLTLALPIYAETLNLTLILPVTLTVILTRTQEFKISRRRVSSALCAATEDAMSLIFLLVLRTTSFRCSMIVKISAMKRQRMSCIAIDAFCEPVDNLPHARFALHALVSMPVSRPARITLQ